TVIRVIRAEVSRLFHAQRGTRPSVSTLMYACRVNPLSGMKVIGCAAASASVLKEVSTAHSPGTSQARARIARITKATMRAGVEIGRASSRERVWTSVVVRREKENKTEPTRIERIDYREVLTNRLEIARKI